MGIHTDGTPLKSFLPNQPVSRAEFGTVFSRVLYGDKYNDGIPYYINHLQALKENSIMTDITNPTARTELRQRVRLMLMRSTT
ncbi:MAG: S-layer homology domain-containing protein [Candidatus Peribacteria bacterium]|jgi:hypothetical protein|nr:S-layer homology domain-containing protein [Candidatus Peribacteria bacterium]